MVRIWVKFGKKMILGINGFEKGHFWSFFGVFNRKLKVWGCINLTIFKLILHSLFFNVDKIKGSIFCYTI